MACARGANPLLAIGGNGGALGILRTGDTGTRHFIAVRQGARAGGSGGHAAGAGIADDMLTLARCGRAVGGVRRRTCDACLAYGIANRRAAGAGGRIAAGIRGATGLLTDGRRSIGAVRNIGHRAC
jgi:hypothetical protein